MENEEWREVVGFEGLYEVSNRGRVRSLDRMTNGPHGSRRIRGRVLKPSTHSTSGYKLVTLRNSGKNRSTSVHSLMAEAFLGSRPNKDSIVAYIDGDPENTHIDNLTWTSFEMVRALSKARKKSSRSG